MNKRILLNLALLITASLVLALVIYFVNFWFLLPLLQRHWWLLTPEVTSEDALFFEGLILIIFGVLALIGSGGINRASRAAALLAAATEAITGKKTVGPGEIYKRDAWKPRGYVRYGLILIITGIILLVICFVSFYYY
jgi:hypothetical protein